MGGTQSDALCINVLCVVCCVLRACSDLSPHTHASTLVDAAGLEVLWRRPRSRVRTATSCLYARVRAHAEARAHLPHPHALEIDGDGAPRPPASPLNYHLP